jgi:hypothetical protein
VGEVLAEAEAEGPERAAEHRAERSGSMEGETWDHQVQTIERHVRALLDGDAPVAEAAQ